MRRLVWELLLVIFLVLVVMAAYLILARATARADAPHCDRQHPVECQHLRERARGLESRVRSLEQALAWQKNERHKDAAEVSRYAVLASQHLDSARNLGPGAGAILAASWRLHTDPQPWIGQGFCESRLDPHAQNGQYAGLFQMSAEWRVLVANLGAGPLDPFNQALVAIRFQLTHTHGSSQWSCKPTGQIRHV